MNFGTLTLQAEKKVRQFLFEREIVIPQQEEFIFTYLSDGLSKGRVIRPVQTNYGVSIMWRKFLEVIPVMLMKESFKKHFKLLKE